MAEEAEVAEEAAAAARASQGSKVTRSPSPAHELPRACSRFCLAPSALPISHPAVPLRRRAAAAPPPPPLCAAHREGDEEVLLESLHLRAEHRRLERVLERQRVDLILDREKLERLLRLRSGAAQVDPPAWRSCGVTTRNRSHRVGEKSAAVIAPPPTPPIASSAPSFRDAAAASN
eukprot:7206807-Prymnesium_polylepis.1